MAKVVAYFLLSSISLLGDSIFLYFVSLNLLQSTGGGMLCSIVFGLDAFFEIVAGPYLSKFIDAIPKLGLRLKRSLSLQVILLLLAFFPALFVSNSQPTVAALLIIAILRFLALIDTQLKLQLPIRLEQQKVTPLMQTLSLSTFSQRCIFLVSASLAPLLLGSSWFFACSLNSFSYLFAIVALLIIIKIVSPMKEVAKQEKTEEENPHRKKWVQWNCWFQLLTNIAFSSVVFILTKSMLMSKGQTPLMQALKGPAPIYAGFLVALFIIMFLPQQTRAIVKNAKRLCFLIFFISVGLLFAAFSNEKAQPLIFFLLGLGNGFSIVGADTFIQRKLEGKGFVKAIAKSQAFGKIGVLISLVLAGLAIDYNFSTTELLTAAGAVGIVVSLIISLHLLILEAVQTEKTAQLN